LWVGCNGTPWENQEYTKDTPFYLLETGELVCNNIKINGGNISTLNCGNVLIQ
jgi:hypothetical protein